MFAILTLYIPKISAMDTDTRIENGSNPVVAMNLSISIFFLYEEVLSMNVIPFHVIVSKPRCHTSLKNTKTPALEFEKIRVEFFS